MRMKPKPKPMWRRLLDGTLYGLFCLVIFAVAVLAGMMSQSSLIKPLVREAIKPTEPEQIFHKPYLNLLILGCDRDITRSGKVVRRYARSDMILVARLDFERNRITGVSIPRDTECQLPGYPRMKINAYHARASEGEENALTQRAVEHLLPGVSIDKVVVIDFDAFQELVDLVGGVDIDVEKRMKYTDRAAKLFIDLKAGQQKLDGYNAMGFVRYRNDSDFERQKRQKAFLVALQQQVIRPENWLSLPKILEQSKDVLNDALSDDELAGLAGFAKRVPQDNIRMGMIPVVEGRGYRRDYSLEVDHNKIIQVLQEFELLPTFQVRLNDR
jgi:polyisoprenyl-teichoic acid--peptidoglycan teichoic acid transferase